MPDIEAVYRAALADHQAGRLESAEALYRQVLAADATHADAWHWLGVVLHQRGQTAAAIGHVEHAINLVPQSPRFYANLGNMYWTIGKAPEAERALRRSLELAPGNPAALATLGHALCVQDRCDEAVRIYDQFLAINPHDPVVLQVSAFALGEQGLIHESIAGYRQAARRVPSPIYSILAALQLPLVYESADDVATWRERLTTEVDSLLAQGVQAGITKQPAAPIFQLPHQGRNDRELQQKITRLFGPPPLLPPPALGREGPRIRVGFLSSDFNSSTIGKLTRGLITRLSRADFHVTVFSIGRYDDPIGRQIAASADRYVFVPRDLEAARQTVLANPVDVLVFTDLGMDQTSYTLAFSRLAPVQCTTWGHPETTGLSTIDYFVSSDLMEIPQADSHYSEKLFRLPSLTFYYDRADAPAERLSRVQLGLDPAATLYSCPQTIYKMHPEFDEALAGILRADPRAQIVLIHWKYRFADELLRRRFARTMPDVADRVVFIRRLSGTEFISFLSLVDVMLDPFPYGGGNTTLEAFSLGLPVVTLPTDFLRGRITQAFCRRVGVDFCIAKDVPDYIQIATRLGTEQSLRDQTRAKIIAGQNRLFEDDSAVRDWEQFFRQATAALSGRGPG